MVQRRKPTLTRDAVVGAAVELADAEGLAALSMRAVARRLGVEAMSLYHHVAHKEDMLDGMVDAVHAEFHAPEIGADWRAELRERCRSGREALKRHPWAVGLMDSRTQAGWETLQHHDAVLGCLRRAGFSLPLTGHAFATLDAFLYGFLVQELALPGTRADDDLGDVAAQLMAAMPADQLPHLREFTLEHALVPGYDFGDEFEVGLDLLLDGLARRLALETAGSASGGSASGGSASGEGATR